MRLAEEDLQVDTKFPILMAKEGKLTKLLIRHGTSWASESDVSRDKIWILDPQKEATGKIHS